jgi:hypothetical protein
MFFKQIFWFYELRLPFIISVTKYNKTKKKTPKKKKKSVYYSI